MIFWRSGYVAFLESEVKALKEENRILLSAILERTGHREAAHMLRGNDPEAQAVAVKVAESKPSIVSRASWRQTRAAAEQATAPKIYQDSGAELEARVEKEKVNL